jgi:uncharacterized membrane protein
MDVLESLFRWFHVFFGVIWIGLLYYFNFVNGQMAAKLDGPTKKAVVPELMPRALFWFRWGAAWTWVTGVFLLALVFYHTRIAFADPSGEWGAAQIISILLMFAAVFVYDAIVKSPIGNTNIKAGIVGLVVVGSVICLLQHWASFGYRSIIIHVGAMFGSIMAFNVWFRIWPAQQNIIKAVKDGKKPDAAEVALAGGRSKHNTYLSMPLLWAMMNAHMFAFSGNTGNLGLTPSTGPYSFLAVMVIGWFLISKCYSRSAKLQGF